MPLLLYRLISFNSGRLLLSTRTLLAFAILVRAVCSTRYHMPNVFLFSNYVIYKQSCCLCYACLVNMHVLGAFLLFYNIFYITFSEEPFCSSYFVGSWVTRVMHPKCDSKTTTSRVFVWVSSVDCQEWAVFPRKGKRLFFW